MHHEGCFLFLQHSFFDQVERTSRKERVSFVLVFEVFFEKSVECRRSEELDRFDESEVFEVGRMSLEEKIGIGDQKVLLAKPWRSGDSE